MPTQSQVHSLLSSQKNLFKTQTHILSRRASTLTINPMLPCTVPPALFPLFLQFFHHFQLAPASGPLHWSLPLPQCSTCRYPYAHYLTFNSAPMLPSLTTYLMWRASSHLYFGSPMPLTWSVFPAFNFYSLKDAIICLFTMLTIN